ncbi:hypothetical protein BDZ94DRAFT_1266178 [Collybia nuda]|uniref:BTB domain-containing protein n=1 Tax=Collybia nuda TaxID=64659 RepID=A0A9P5XZ29_9AGAR|nr:hypothetical protein BDZ94DRAFT_1266178 [Collybia nuda]
MTTPPTTTNVSRHERYYFDDEISIFLVENKLFKVHRHFLTRESDLFRMMFTSPPPPEGKDGVSDDRPIHLPEVKAQEFERLLDFFYQRAYHSRDSLLFSPVYELEAREAHSKDDTFFEQWIDLLSIATRFDFQSVRRYSISAIQKRVSPLEPVKRICLAVKFDIPEWLAAAFESLCQRDNPLEIFEAEIIGLKYTTLLARAREEIRDSARNSTSRNKKEKFQFVFDDLEEQKENLPYDASLVTRIVKRVFFPSDPAHPSGNHREFTLDI